MVLQILLQGIWELWGVCGGEVWAVGAMGRGRSGEVWAVGHYSSFCLLLVGLNSSLSYIPSQNSTTWIVLNVEDFMPRSILTMGMYMQHHALQ